MTKRTLGIIVAMPEEIKFLIQDIPAVTRSTLGAHPVYRFTQYGREFVLIESGIGPDRALAAVQALTEACAPELIISMGFAGAVTPDLDPGDVVIATRIFTYEDQCLSEERTDRLTPLPPGTPSSMGAGSFRITEGAIISTARIQPKKVMVALVPTDVKQAVLDMETCAIARFTTLARIPLMAIRTVSDDSREELGFTMDEFMNASDRVSVVKVFATVLRKPWIVPQLIRLAGNTRRAGTNLALVFGTLREHLA